MNNITNTIEFEYEGFTLKVNYNFRKGHAGTWFEPPEENSIDINNTEIISYTNEDNNIIDLNDIIKEEIMLDVESFF